MSTTRQINLIPRCCAISIQPIFSLHFLLVHLLVGARQAALTPAKRMGRSGRATADQQPHKLSCPFQEEKGYLKHRIRDYGPGAEGEYLVERRNRNQQSQDSAWLPSQVVAYAHTRR